MEVEAPLFRPEGLWIHPGNRARVGQHNPHGRIQHAQIERIIKSSPVISQFFLQTPQEDDFRRNGQCLAG